MAVDAATSLDASAPPTPEVEVDLERFFARALDLLCVASAQGFFLRVNPAFSRVLGYSSEELMQRPFLDFVHPDDVAATLAEVERLAQGAITVDFENRYRCRDGSYRTLRWCSTPDPASGYLYATARDVTETRARERELAQLSKKLSLAIEAAPNAFVMVDAAGQIVLVNTTAEAMFGYSRDELLGCGIDLLVPERDRGRHPAHRQSFMGRPETRRMGVGRDLTARRKDGTEFPVEIGLNPISTDAGMMVMSSIVDITERKNAEKALRERDEHLELLLRSTGEAIYGIDLEGRCTFCNDACLRMLGYGAMSELLGRDMHAMIHHSRPDGSAYAAQDCRIDRAFREGKGSHQDDEVLWRADGTSFAAECWSHPVRRGDEAIGAVVAFVDITERKRMEEALRAKNAELKAFAYTVSHDLKAPLRGITGYAQELERKHGAPLSERGRFCVTQVVTAARNLDRLIEDLLLYSRLESESPSIGDVDLHALIRSILRDRGHVISERGVEVSVEVPDAVSRVRGWERAWNQVLSNLIDNALKYSRDAKPPRVALRVEHTGDRLRLSVADNGIGFDMRYLDRIFGLFNRLVRAEDFEGTGAGLAIVKKLVEKQQGRVWAESAPNQGATFFVELPIA